MGQRSSKLAPSELDELTEITAFSKKEIEQWYRGFIKDCPSGELDKANFQKTYEEYFPFGESQDFSREVFKVFDTDGNGKITFKEFICALSITSRGNMDDKLEWAFKLYDIDGDGKISHDEMLTIVDSIYKLVAASVKLDPKENTPEKRVDAIFESMDKDKNGSLDLDEFKAGAQADPTILAALNLYNGLV